MGRGVGFMGLVWVGLGWAGLKPPALGRGGGGGCEPSVYSSTPHAIAPPWWMALDGHPAETLGHGLGLGRLGIGHITHKG